MSKLYHCFWAKAVAIILFLFCSTATVYSGTGIIMAAEAGYYTSDTPSYYDSTVCYNATWNNLYDIENFWRQYLDGTDTDKVELTANYASYLPEGDTNFFFTIQDGNGNIVFSTYNQQKYGLKLAHTFDYENYVYNPELTYDEDGNLAEAIPTSSYTITGYVQQPLQSGDGFYEGYQFFQQYASLSSALIPIFIIVLLASIFLFIFLMRAAGLRKETDEVKCYGLDRIPLDLYAVIIFLLELAISAIGFNLANSYLSTNLYEILIYSPLIALFFLLILGFFMSLSTRIKAHTWWRNTLIYYLCHGIKKLIVNMHAMWKTVLGFLGFIIIDAILAANIPYNGGALFIAIIFNIAVFVGLCRYTLQVRKLRISGEKLANGELDYHVETEKMFPELKKHGENLNNISSGMAKAVQEQMKSEHFRTELITNVSHDLKTPLTSIINYVDLLKKENISPDKAKEYVEVLDRQSAKLKKLTEDLVEASKAATGNINVNLSSTNIAELLNQSIAEYEERLKDVPVEAVLNAPDYDVTVLADGRLLWRVFDNLLSNICKYSQPNTRAYFTIEDGPTTVAITIKNISRDILNVSVSELMERFVRGDSSRTTEGSGLGLSIAKSLTELQHGSFDLQVDGDLFKAILTFNK